MDEQDPVLTFIKRLPHGTQRSYLALFWFVREYALELIEEVKAKSPAGEPTDAESKAKLKIAERLAQLLSDTAAHLHDDEH